MTERLPGPDGRVLDRQCLPVPGAGHCLGRLFESPELVFVRSLKT
jgi:hypothetical protein